MVPAGIAAQAQGESFWYLLLLATIASAGRMIAGSILYFAADKVEDLVFAKGRKLFGLTHERIENLGKKLSQKHSRNTWLGLFVLSAVPFLPTSALSLTVGFVKIRFSTFFTSNFLGSIINATFFLYLGYAGVEGARLITQLDLIGQTVTIAILLLLLGGIVWWRIKHKKI